MNTYTDWRNGNALRGALENMETPQVVNFNSIEGVLKSIIGEKPLANAPLTSALVEKLHEEVVLDAPEEILNESDDTTDDVVETGNSSDVYKIYRDKDESFECKVSVQGAGLNNAQVRLFFDCDIWNVVFYGKLYKDGNCVILIKKNIPLPEGTFGRARLEVIIDDQVFIPWESSFTVEGSKKVKVELKQSKAVKISMQTK